MLAWLARVDTVRVDVVAVHLLKGDRDADGGRENGKGTHDDSGIKPGMGGGWVGG
jgi:hypothetical protein